MKLWHLVVGAVILGSVGQCNADSDVGSGVRVSTQRDGVARSTAPSEPSGARPRREHAASSKSTEQSPSSASSAEPDAAKATAVAALSLLPVKGRAPMTGYDRDRFGPAWLDADRNGCDTRNDILAQYLRAVRLENNGCVVAAGSYEDPYTGSKIEYWHGDGALIDIDHVVSMGNAWATGAFGWEIKKRAAFANDPLNLLPADAGANRQKGDGDAATWLPANKSFRCAYVSRQVAVKAKYDLHLTAPEKAAIQRVLTTCLDQALQSDTWGAPTVVDHNITDPAEPGGDAGTKSSPTPSAPVSPVATGSVYFQNCDAARAAGAGPVRLGDPGYGNHLDGDGDGIACE